MCCSGQVPQHLLPVLYVPWCVLPEKREIPKFLRKPSNIESLEFEDIKFQTSVTGKPVPEITWFMADKKLEPSERIIYEQVQPLSLKSEI